MSADAALGRSTGIPAPNHKPKISRPSSRNSQGPTSGIPVPRHGSLPATTSSTKNSSSNARPRASSNQPHSKGNRGRPPSEGQVYGQKKMGIPLTVTSLPSVSTDSLTTACETLSLTPTPTTTNSNRRTASTSHRSDSTPVRPREPINAKQHVGAVAIFLTPDASSSSPVSDVTNITTSTASVESKESKPSKPEVIVSPISSASTAQLSSNIPRLANPVPILPKPPQGGQTKPQSPIPQPQTQPQIQPLPLSQPQAPPQRNASPNVSAPKSAPQAQPKPEPSKESSETSSKKAPRAKTEGDILVSLSQESAMNRFSEDPKRRRRATFLSNLFGGRSNDENQHQENQHQENIPQNSQPSPSEQIRQLGQSSGSVSFGPNKEVRPKQERGRPRQRGWWEVVRKFRGTRSVPPPIKPVAPILPEPSFPAKASLSNPLNDGGRMRSKSMRTSQSLKEDYPKIDPVTTLDGRPERSWLSRIIGWSKMSPSDAAKSPTVMEARATSAETIAKPQGNPNPNSTPTPTPAPKKKPKVQVQVNLKPAPKTTNRDYGALHVYLENAVLNPLAETPPPGPPPKVYVVVEADFIQDCSPVVEAAETTLNFASHLQVALQGRLREVRLSVFEKRTGSRFGVDELIATGMYKMQVPQLNGQWTSDSLTLKGSVYKIILRFQAAVLRTGALSMSPAEKLLGRNKRANATQEETDAREKRQRLLGHVVNEVTNTEQGYVDSLRHLVELFIEPLRHPEGTTPALDPAEIETIFPSIESLCQMHASTILPKLLYSAERGGVGMGAAFLNWAPNLKQYTHYLNNYQAGTQLLYQLLETNPDFNRFVTAQSADPRMRNLQLVDLLVKPFQRLTKYGLLLRELVKYTDTTSPESASLKAAMGAIESVTREMNEQRREVENRTKLEQINALVQSTIPDFLTVEGRHFVCSGTFRQARKRRPVDLYLFSDLSSDAASSASPSGILVVTRSGKLFTHFALNAITFEYIAETVDNESTIRIYTLVSLREKPAGSLALELQAVTAEAKGSWVDAFIDNHVMLEGYPFPTITMHSSPPSLTAPVPITPEIPTLNLVVLSKNKDAGCRLVAWLCLARVPNLSSVSDHFELIRTCALNKSAPANRPISLLLAANGAITRVTIIVLRGTQITDFTKNRELIDKAHGLVLCLGVSSLEGDEEASDWEASLNDFKKPTLAVGMPFAPSPPNLVGVRAKKASKIPYIKRYVECSAEDGEQARVVFQSATTVCSS
eukprot:c13715_g1_i2.p1 GENE.c13715_g1_i2~~c13715_g1_i2.p1  ORF type:complete len:1241 (+),score=243.38 c13715_g1_i2:86-3808(+)